MAVEYFDFCHDVDHLSSFSFAKSVWHGRGALVLNEFVFQKNVFFKVIVAKTHYFFLLLQ